MGMNTGMAGLAGMLPQTPGGSSGYVGPNSPLKNMNSMVEPGVIRMPGNEHYFNKTPEQPVNSAPTSVSDFLNGGVANPMYNQSVNTNTGFGGFNPQRDIPIPTSPAKVNPNMGFSGFGGNGGGGGGGQSMDLGNLSVNFNPAGGNSYAKGGEVGLKSAARELEAKGRNGDTMLAHINPQEARMLKAMGGSGTINPATGLPEYWGIKIGPVGIGSDYGGVSVGNTSIGDVLDKSGVGDLIGSLGPIAPMAATYFGGPLAAGIVGGIGRNGKFNFQRALMTGALAYGAQNLAQGLGDAGTAGTSASSGAPGISVDDLGVPLLPVDAAATASVGQSAIPSIVYDDMGQALLPADQAAMQQGIGTLGDKASYYGSRAMEGVSNFGNQVSNAAKGAYNLSTGAPGASEAFKASGATMMNTAAPIYMGATGVMAIDEAEKMQLEADLANAKSKEEYDSIMARIEASKQRGIDAMRANPYQFAEGGLASLGTEVPSTGAVNPLSSIRLSLISKFPSLNPETITPVPEGSPLRGLGSIFEAFKDRANEVMPEQIEQGEGFRGLSGVIDSVIDKLGGLRGNLNGASTKEKPYETMAYEAMRANPHQYAYGGSIDDNPGADDYNMAKGGMPPRFLSGGGDGMSDDIPAVIGDRQPARLADGEFVIPADVVSHLGNGSSKAGAKQLYSMMDKVRSARTGNKKQGKQINPAKYMPA
jgi:hypothetical protein